MLQKYAEANRKLSLAQEQLAIANQKLKEYEEKAQKAEKASKMKSLFLANMSHEIRTPLNAIEGFSRVLVETDSQDDRMKFFEIIESNNNRLMSLVNEILDLSRVEAGEITMKKSSTDLNQLCDSIKNLFKFRCPETVKLSWKKPNMAVTFNTDANRITQVFSNQQRLETYFGRQHHLWLPHARRRLKHRILCARHRYGYCPRGSSAYL